MPPREIVDWLDHFASVLQQYDEILLRQVAGKLFKPRSQWPPPELLQRTLDTVRNAPMIDRRLRELPAACRQILALIGQSRQPRWYLGHLVEMLVALGHEDGLTPVLTLLETGLLYPDLPPVEEKKARLLMSLNSWLAQSSPAQLGVVALPQVTARCLHEELSVPLFSAEQGALAELPATLSLHEADGLDWPLRLAVLWQMVRGGSLRRTQQRDFFKRDLDKLRADPLLTSGTDANLPDIGLLTAALALEQGILVENDTALEAGALPPVWQQGLAEVLAATTAALLRVTAWTPQHGWQPASELGNPYPSAYLLLLALLARQPSAHWLPLRTATSWVAEHHPYWAQANARADATAALDAFLVGLAAALKLVQLSQQLDQSYLVRLSPLGRWLLGQGDLPNLPTYAQTLLVQPNLEILAYRQGLTPALLAKLSLLAAWKSLGPACTLQLQPETIYSALEAGETFASILQTLERHGMKATPPAVIDSLRTWADKRERISLYPAAALFEFASADDLNEALKRGLPAVRLSERVAIVANEQAIDYRHFRLTATRDYAAPPERCVQVDDDGVTLHVDLARSDLLLESELLRFAEAVESSNGRSTYRVTPGSLLAARAHGQYLSTLEQWFQQRTMGVLPPAVRMLLSASQSPAVQARALTVVQVATPELADGLLQWPGTRSFFTERLGPTALVVAVELLPELRVRLQQLGLGVVEDRLESTEAAAPDGKA